MLEKSLYRSMLVEDNKKMSAFSPRNYHYAVPFIKCICGSMLEKKDLAAYFSPAETDEIFAEIQAPAKPPGEESKVPLHKGPDPAGVGRPVEPKPNEEKPKGTLFKTVCCRAMVDDGALYLSDFVDTNLKLKNSGEKISEDRMICPICSKISTRYDLEKAYTKAVIDPMMSQLFAKVCGECKVLIQPTDAVVESDCGHTYHLLCAQAYLQQQQQKDPLIKCRVEGCGKYLYNWDSKVKRELEKRCIVCLKTGQKFAILTCKHYICFGCAEGFRKDANACIKYEEDKGATYAVADCGICNRARDIESVLLKCGHTMSLKDIQKELQEFVKEMSRPCEGSIIGHNMREVDPWFPICETCNIGLDDVEIFAVVGKQEGAKILPLLDRSLKLNVAAERKASEEQKKVPSPLPVSQYIKEPVGKIGVTDAEKTIHHAETVPVKQETKPPMGKTKMCTKCRQKKESTMGRYVCEHMNMCEECLNEHFFPMLKHGLSNECATCHAATNPEFIHRALRLIPPENIMGKHKMEDWLFDHVL